ncbi:MAG TPA: hypothetical protein VHQ45_06390 [Gemmatimonadaceae bacterium]|nr:hypothetical protein [Gemmatimonadaceae bacterium]
MNEFLHDRIRRKLETLSDERLYQVLDYVEFLESRYAERATPAANVFQKFAEGVEDRLRAGRVSATTIAETMNLMNRAVGVLSGVAAAGKSVASDIVDVASGVAAGVTTPSTGTTPGSGTPATRGANAAPARPASSGAESASPPPQTTNPSSSGEPKA